MGSEQPANPPHVIHCDEQHVLCTRWCRMRRGSRRRRGRPRAENARCRVRVRSARAVRPVFEVARGFLGVVGVERPRNAPHILVSSTRRTAVCCRLHNTAELRSLTLRHARPVEHLRTSTAPVCAGHCSGSSNDNNTNKHCRLHFADDDDDEWIHQSMNAGGLPRRNQEEDGKMMMMMMRDDDDDDDGEEALNKK